MSMLDTTINYLSALVMSARSEPANKEKLSRGDLSNLGKQGRSWSVDYHSL
ncbi:hypothetical protein LCGC14_1966630 [marine sediment metagenome]|uniref:Uncharacterized protein n=1 Tax=marine sediment metagenome TaxID=412755 RepID=A0A0F9G1D2_9ZZZZ